MLTNFLVYYIDQVLKIILAYSSGSQLGVLAPHKRVLAHPIVLAPPEGVRRDFLGCKLLFSTNNNTSNGARGAKMIFPSGWGAGFKMN